MPMLSEDREAIRDLYARYTLYLRAGAVDKYMALFTDVPVFTGGGPDIVGRAALEEQARIWAGQHVHRMIQGHVIDVDGDVATCQASVVVYTGLKIASVGSTSDELYRIDGAWRIHRRCFVADA